MNTSARLAVRYAASRRWRRPAAALFAAASTVGGLTFVGVTRAASAGTAYTSPVSADSPAVYYRLDESSGTTAGDSSGNGLSGTYGTNGSGGGITFGVPGALTDSQDASDTAITADGSVTVPVTSSANLPVTGDSPWTIEAWYRSTSSNPQTVVSFGAAGTEQAAGLSVWPSTGGQPGYRLALDLYQNTVEWDGTNLNDGRWHQLAVSYAGGGRAGQPGFAAYVDGRALGAGTLNGVTFPLQITAGPVRVGGWTDTNYEKPLNGSVDEVAVFPSAVPATDIATQYQAAGVRPGPAAKVAVSLSSPTVAADGTSIVTATATVTDAAGTAVDGDNLTIASSDTGQTLPSGGTMTDAGRGVYTATVTASKAARSAVLTVTDNTANPKITGTATVTQTATAAATIKLAVTPTAIPADGRSVSTVLASVTDANGNPLTADTPTATSTDTGEKVGTVTAVGDGTYRIPVTSSTTAGTPTVTVTDGAASATTTVVQYAPAAASAPACTDTWSGQAGDGSWSNAANWDAAGGAHSVPSATDVACLPATPDGAAAPSTYTVTLTGSVTVASVVVGGTVAAGGTATTQTLAVSSASCSSTTLTTNGGVIEPTGVLDLTDTGAGCGSATTVTVGPGYSLTDQGSIVSDPGSGGGRYWNGSVVDQGGFTVNAGITYGGAGSVFDDRGTLTVAQSQLFLVPNAPSGQAGQTLVADQGGTIAGAGTVTIGAGDTMVQGDGTITATSPPVVSGASNVAANLDYTGTGAGTIDTRDLVQLAGNLAAGQNLVEQAQSCDGVTVTLASSVANAGTITLTSLGGGCGATSILAAVPGAVLTNTGTIVTDPANGNTRYIRASLVNTGTVTINQPTYLDHPGTFFDQRGNLAVNAGLTVPLDQGGSAAAVTFENTAGQITGSNGAYIFMDGGNNWVQGDGSFAATAAPPVIQGWNGGSAPSYVTFTGTGSAAATLILRDKVAISGDIGSSEEVQIQAQYCDSAVTTAAGSFTNNGTVDLTSISGGCGSSAYLRLPPGATMTNAGTVITDPANGNNRYLEGSITNTGTVSVAAQTYLDQAGTTFDNQGALTLAANLDIPANGAGAAAPVVKTFVNDKGGDIGGSAALTMEAGNRFVQGAGTISDPAPPVLSGGNGIWAALSFTGTGASTVQTRDLVQLTGNLATDQNLVVQGQYCDSATLAVPAPITNAGTITLTSLSGGCGATAFLAASPGAVLTNSGTIVADPANGNTRYLRASLVNTGTVNIDQPTNFDQAGATFDNQGTLTMAASLALPNNGNGALSSETFRSTSGTIAATGGPITVGYGDTWVQGGGTLTTGSQPVGVYGGSGIPAAISMQGAGPVTIDAFDLTTLTGTVAAGQAIYVTAAYCDGASMTATGSVTNAGVIDLTSNSGGCSPSAILTIPTGSTLTNSGTLQADAGQGGGRQFTGALDNTGTLAITTGVGLTVNGAVTTTGAVSVGSSGSLTLSQAPTNISGTTLPGAWKLAGNVSWPGAGSFTTISGSVQRAGGTITDSANNNADALSAVTEVSPGADLAVTASDISDSATLSNDGTVDLTAPAGALSASALQPAGYTQSDSGQLDVSVNNTGASTLAPGSGQATLGGTLTIATNRSVPPKAGSRFHIIVTTATPTGQFKTVQGQSLSDRSDYAVSYGPDGVWLTVAEPTTTTLTSSAAAATSDFGTPVTLTATVTATTATTAPTGSVVFTDTPAGGQATQLCAAAPVTAAGAATATATCVLPALPAGTHSISAAYSDPSLTFGSSTGTLTETVNQVATTTVATATTATTAAGAAAGTVEYGTPVTYGATVTPNSGTGSLDGPKKLSFSVSTSGGQAASPAGCADLPLASGAASCTAAHVPVGTESMTAGYLGDANSQASTSAPVTYTVTPRATTGTLTSSAAPAIAGQALTLTYTATAGDSAPAGLQPTGTVSFYDSAATNPDQPIASCAGVALSGGSATCTTATLTPGSHTITASYSDPAGNFSPAQATLAQDVAHSGLTLTTSGSPTTYGKAVTFTAELTGSGTMGGTVTFTDSVDGAAPVTICPAVTVTPGAAGQASAACSPANLAVGLHQVTASYSGDPANEAATGQATVQIKPRATTVTVTSSKARSTVGDAVTFTATVSGGTGSVTFTDQVLGGPATTICAPSVALSGTTATCQVSDLTVGDHTITASYSGDANDNPSDASTGQSVQPAATTTGLTVAGTGPLTLTATVSGGINATGTVTFTDITSSGSTVLCPGVTLTSGAATCSVNSLGTGGHALVASYSGDSSNSPSSATISDGVPRATTATTVSLTSGANPATTGDSLTFTASVTGGRTPTGTVTFSDVTPAGTATLCPAQPVGSGTVTCTTTTLAAGGHSIVATYSGDTDNLTSSGTTVETVDPPAKSASSTTLKLISGTDPAVIGTALTVEATVAATPAPTGTVTFSIVNASGVSTACQAVTVSATATADCQLPALPAGANAVTASYSGDGNDAGSSAAITETVTGAPTTTTVAETTGTDPSTSGDSLVFTATVAGGHSETGTVTFSDVTGSASAVICPAVTLTGGTATCSTSSLGVGGHAIVASYSGDAANQASVGAASQTVQASGTAQASTTTVASSTGTAPAAPGATVTFTATVTGAGTPTGSVAFVDVTPSGTSSLCPAVPLSGGTAQCQTSGLASGAHAIVADYSGDSANSASTATTAQEVAVPALAVPAVALTRATGGASTTYGSPVTFVAQLTGGSSPTGTVTFTDTTPAGAETTLCSNVAVTGGTAQCVASALAPGSHAIGASYSGDSANSAAASPTLVQVVAPAATTTTVTRTTGSDPSVAGTPLKFTAQVAPQGTGGPAPTGSVTFTATSSSGSSTICAAVPLASGAAVCDATALPIGTFSVVAAYSGDTYNAASSATTDQSVTAAPLTGTTTAVAQTTGTDPSVAGDTIAFTATVTVTGGASTSPAPTGTVDFSYTTPTGTTPICSKVALTKGAASCDASGLAAGSYAIVATYSGDATDAGSSGTVAHTVGAAPRAATTTAVALTSGTNPSTYQAALTFTATVTGGSKPTGTVTFTAVGPAGTVNLCANPVALSAGTASCTNSTLAAGAYAVVATYSGDSANAGSSATTSQAVDQPGLAATSTAVASSADPSTAGNPVTFTATVTGGSKPTGTVTFTDTSPAGGTTLCSKVALTGGRAQCVAANLAAGSHAVVATYSGDGANAGSAATLAQQVDQPTKATTTVTMPLDKNGPNPSTAGQQVTFTAAVTGSGTVTGTVTFTDTAQNQSPVTLCSSVPLSGGTATCATTALTAGAHAVSATYSGDATHTGNSATVAELVKPTAGYADACTSASLVQTGSQLVASATGCPDPQFEFLEYQGSRWQVVQPYGGGATYTLPTTAGTYSYAVWARDTTAPASDSFYDVYAVRTVTVTVSPCTVSLSVGLPSGVGSAGTVTATPQSGYCAGADYQFLIETPTSSWSYLGSRTTANSVSWTPQASGTYSFYVYLTAGGVSGNTVGVVQAVVPAPTRCSATPSLSITAIGAPSSASYPPGQKFTVSASESGCSHPLYQFFVLTPSSGTWRPYIASTQTFATTYTLSDYSATSSLTWDSTGAGSGTTYWYVSVRDQSDTSGYVVGTSSTVTLANDVACTKPAGTATATRSGSQIIISQPAAASCSHPEYLYMVWNSANPANGWNVVPVNGSSTNYTTSPTFTASPYGSAFTWVEIWVRHQGYNREYDYYQMIPVQ